MDSALLDWYPFLFPYLAYQPVEEYHIFTDWNLTALKEEVSNRKVQDLLTYDTLSTSKIKEKLHKLDCDCPKELGFLRFVEGAEGVVGKAAVFILPVTAVMGGVVALLYFCPSACLKLFSVCMTCIHCGNQDKPKPDLKVIYRKAKGKVEADRDLEEGPPPFSPSAPPKIPLLSIKASASHPLPLPCLPCPSRLHLPMNKWVGITSEKPWKVLQLSST